MAEEQVNVAIGELDRFDEVVREVCRLGFTVEQELKEIGVVSGSIDEGKLEELRRVKGVDSVERTRDVRIPPPDSPIM